MSEMMQGVLVGGIVAVVAAVLTLLTERWKARTTARADTANWRRQTMFSVAHRYLDIGFAISGTASNARRSRVAGQPLGVVQGHLDTCHELHGELTTHLTALRLIAPRNVVLAAEGMHDSVHLLINSAMGRAEPNSIPETELGAFEELKRRASRDRLTLLVAIRAVFGIDEDVVPFGAKVESSWTVPADEYPPAL